MKSNPLSQIIIGHHSIKAALDNKNRKCLEFCATTEGLNAFCKYHKISKQDISNKVQSVRLLDAHQFQQSAMKSYSDLGFEYQKITSGAFLIAKSIAEISWQDLIKISHSKKIIALDHVTDIHNAAAIIRTCAFYGVGALIKEIKGSFSLSPGLIRTASGGIESVPLFTTNSLLTTLKNLKQQQIKIIGLSEEEKNTELPEGVRNKNSHMCLVFGSEDKGLSHAVERELDVHLSIPPIAGSLIKSLNVSVATAVCLERLRIN